jgi:hypothetical protein
MIQQYLAIIGSVLGIIGLILTPIIVIVRYQDKVDNHEKRLEEIEKKKIPDVQKELKSHLDKDVEERRLLAENFKNFAVKLERLSTLIELNSVKRS